MRGFVIIDIDRFNSLLNDRNIGLLAFKQHVCLILKAFAGNLQHLRDNPTREYTKSGLCIADLESAEKPEYGRSQLIAETALRRHMRQIEIADAEHQRIFLLLEHHIDTGRDVLREMLIVAVDRNRSDRILAVLHEPCKRSFERSALAFVDTVMQHLAAERCALFKEMLILLRRAVINEQDIRESFFLHAPDYI